MQRFSRRPTCSLRGSTDQVDDQLYKHLVTLSEIGQKTARRRA